MKKMRVEYFESLKQYCEKDIKNMATCYPKNKKIISSHVKENGCDLQYVKNQTEEMCLRTVKQSGWVLKYVNEQTEEMCLEAMKKMDWH